MGVPSPGPSALQSFISTHKQPADYNHPTHLNHLALQIAYNLRFQHSWTDIRIHFASPDSVFAVPLPRPLLSGFPPQRLYVHPDEQLELLQKQKDEGGVGMPELSREREWVLPSQLREKWSLKRFGEVFDAIPAIPLEQDGEVAFKSQHHDTVMDTVETEADESVKSASPNEWRTMQPKRLLLATLDDDSTIVYYIVHDGIVKPRQN